MSDFVSLNSNGDFRRLYNRGKTVTDPALVIYYSENRAGICRVGITTSKKIGNAVERNRSRRIIRAAAREVLADAEPRWDFVFVARSKTKYLKAGQIAFVMKKHLTEAGVLSAPPEKEKNDEE